MNILEDFLNEAISGLNKWNTVQPLDKWRNIEREQRQYHAWCIYNHEYKPIVYRTIQARYKHAWKDIATYIQPVENPLKKVAQIKSQTYSRPPVRRTNNEQIRILIKRNQFHINKALMHASRVLNATGNVLIWPVVGLNGSSIASELRLLVIPPHRAYVKHSYIDCKYDVVAEYDDAYLVSMCNEEGWRTKLWTGKYAKSWAYYGDPVWVSLGESEIDCPRSVGEITDLIVGTIEIGVMEAFATKINYLKSFKQPLQVGDYSVTPDQMIAGPEQIWSAEVGLIDLADKNDMYESMIQNRSISLMGQHGVSKTAALGEYLNEQSWLSISQEMLQHWESQTQLWLGVEDEIWRSICAMDCVNLDPENKDNNVHVRFLPPYPTMRDPKTAWELHKDQVKHGCASTTDYLLEQYNWLEDEKAADELYKNNLERYAQEINMKRALNIGDNGLSPEYNGQLGPLTKSIANGILGRGGPSVDNHEVESDLLNDGGKDNDNDE